MKLAVWKNRAAAAAVIVLTGLSLVSLVPVTTNILAVREAEARAAADRPKPLTAPPAPQAMRPILRRGAATQDIAIGEFLNGRLSELGFSPSSVDTLSIRPLGGGLQLAEVRVQGRGDATAAAAVANWVAVNREVVRLKSLSLSTGADGAGNGVVVLLMVIA